MKRILSICCFLAFCNNCAFAQQLSVVTTRYIGADSAFCQIFNAINDTDGGIIFVGGTELGNGTGDLAVPGHAKRELMLGKMDSNMHVLWLKTYGSNEADQGSDCKILTEGNGYAVLGGSHGSDGDLPPTNQGSGDIWLLRLDASANILWSKLYGGPGPEDGMSIAQTPDGGFIMAGIHTGNVLGGDVLNTYSTSPFSTDWFVVKVDSLGNKQWAKAYGGSDLEDDPAILSTPFGVFLVGSSLSHDYDCLDTSWHPLSLKTIRDYFILKLDPDNGDIIWSKSYGGSSGEAVYPNGVMWDGRDSTIVIGGYSSSNDYMMHDFHGGEGGDMCLVKVDYNGVFKWSSLLGTDNEEAGMSVCKGPDGGYFLSGGIFNTGTIPKPPGYVGGTQDLMVFAADSLGRELTHKIFGSTDADGFVDGDAVPFKHGIAVISYAGSVPYTEGLNIAFHKTISDQTAVSYLSYAGLGIGETPKGAQPLKLYPNPTDGIVTIELPAGHKRGQLSVTGTDGKTVFQKTYPAGGKRIRMDAAPFAKGIYLVRWKPADEGIWIARLIVR